MNRRSFLGLAAASVATGCTLPEAPASKAVPCGYHVFSKMFQKITDGYDGCAELMAKAGFDGIQWTVRKKGHVLPENVRRDLPRAVRAAERQGLSCVSICTDISDGNDPVAETIAKTAADCGIRLFRPAYYFYDAKKETFRQSLDRIARGFASLEALGRRAGVKATYQNHSSWGPSVFGGVVWDVYTCIRDLDPAYVGLEYDPMHALYETNQSWTHGFDLVAPWIGAIDLKDFHWKPSPKNPKLTAKNMVAAGEGVVPWGEVLRMQKAHGVKVPYIVHFEYDFNKTDLPKTVRSELDAFRKIFG